MEKGFGINSKHQNIMPDLTRASLPVATAAPFTSLTTLEEGFANNCVSSFSSLEHSPPGEEESVARGAVTSEPQLKSRGRQGPSFWSGISAIAETI